MKPFRLEPMVPASRFVADLRTDCRPLDSERRVKLRDERARLTAARRFGVLARSVIAAIGVSVGRAQTLKTRPITDYHPAPFVHPGLLHTRTDLERMRTMVAQGVEPWKSGFEKLKAHPSSSAEWPACPFEHVERSLLTGRGLGKDQLERDCNAAYQNALMWCITGDEAHAKKAVEILDAWTATLKVLDGTDVELAAGLCGFKLANAAELMRATYPAWTPAEIERCQHMLHDVFYPPIQDFALWAHGNWDLACMKGMMAIGVFCDDHALFNRAVDFFFHGEGNGALLHYVVNETGQVQESGRDQQHTQLGVGQLCEMCEIGWSQELDMYGTADNRLLKGFEYVARYDLGEDVPFAPYTDTSGRFPAERISANGRGNLRAIFEMALNHYAGRKGLAAPWTRKAAEKLRPEGQGFGADHPGFGTLLFTVTPSAP
jgi:hypothetical protein